MSKKLVKEYVLGMVERFRTDQVTLYAAQSELFIIMSLVPFMMVMAMIARALNLDESVVVSIAESLAPSFVSDGVSDLINQMFTNSVALVSLSIISLLWSSGKALQGIQYGLNSVNRISDRRNWLVLRIKAVFNTVVLLFSMAFLSIFVIYGRELGDIVAMASENGRIPFLLNVLVWLRFIIAFVLMVVFFTTVYRSLPNRNYTFLEQLPSGICCAVAWLVFTIFLVIFNRAFGMFSIYGSLMMLLLSMFWLYCCMIIFFVCAMCQPILWYAAQYLYAKKVLKIRKPQIPVSKEILAVCEIGRKIEEKSYER